MRFRRTLDGEGLDVEQRVLLVLGELLLTPAMVGERRTGRVEEVESAKVEVRWVPPRTVDVMVGDECLREALLLRPLTSSWIFVSPLTFPAPWPPWLCCESQLPDEIVAREVFEDDVNE